MEGKNVMRVVIQEARSIKSLVSSLHELLPAGVNLHFTKDGIKINAIDSSKTKLVNVKLNASKFSEYKLEHNLTLGIPTRILDDRISSVTNDDMVEFFYDEETNKENRFGYKIYEQNGTNGRHGYIKLIDIDDENNHLKKKEFTSVFMIPSDLFQKTCRIMSKINNIIEIKTINKQIIFHTESDDGEETAIFGDTDPGLQIIKNNPVEIYQAYYDLKCLLLYAKGSSISTNIKLCMANDYPLVIDTEVGSLGEMKLLLSPKIGNDDN